MMAALVRHLFKTVKTTIGLRISSSSPLILLLISLGSNGSGGRGVLRTWREALPDQTVTYVRIPRWNDRLTEVTAVRDGPPYLCVSGSKKPAQV